jgi:RHS repeat-associated protein
LVDGTLTPGDGEVSTSYNLDRLGRTVYAIDDDGSMTEQLFDGAGRMIHVKDPVGNKIDRSFDDNDSLVKMVEWDIYPNGSYRSFETYSVLDSLNRVLSTTDNIGRTERLAYDSRGYMVHRSDATASLSSQYINGRQVNNPGNTTSRKVDGFGRIVREDSDLRVGGTGDGLIDSPTYNVDGRSTRTFEYDRNSRLLVATDDSWNETAYEYDALDRLVLIRYQDDTEFTQAFDGNDNIESWTDARGAHAELEYDDKNRLIEVNATVSGSVVGTTKLVYEYDGLDRMTRSTDSVDGIFPSSNDWVNEYTWDALGRAKTQKQNNRTVTNAWREESKKTATGYTSGVTVQYAYDAIERATTVTQGVQLASFSYAGKDRLLQRSDYAGVVQRYHSGSWDDSAHYDGARRPVKLEFVKGAALLTGIEHGFDRANNRLYTRRLHNASRGDNFVYDSMYRLGTWERDVPAASVGVPGGSSFKARHTFELDGVHSRHRTTRALPNQIPVPTVITVDGVHNYTAKQQGIGPQFTTWGQTFDFNGNKTAFTDQGTHPTYKYDFLNRLRVIEQGTEKVEFDFDAEGRRVRTKVTGLTGYPATTEFIHDGQHVIEELNANGQCLRRFYYGDNLDELVGYENLSFYPGPGSYFYEQDSAGDVVAIHDASGNVVERYTYGAYGSVFFATSASVVKNIERSDYGNPYCFKGLRYENYYDALYYVRARFLDCADGTFMQRDPIGVWGDRVSMGSPKAYSGGNPTNWEDPFGKEVFAFTRNLAGNTCGPNHCATVITPTGSGHKPEDAANAAKSGTATSYGGHDTSANGDGNIDIRKNDPKDMGQGDVSDPHFDEIPAPENCPQEDWDAAFKEAGEDAMKEFGGTEYFPEKDKDGNLTGKNTCGVRRFRGKNKKDYAAIGIGVNCRDINAWIIDRAVEILKKKGKLPKDYRYKAPKIRKWW